MRNRQLGVRSGVPDLCLPIPASGYHGLYIELKTVHGKPTDQQQRWISALNGFGYLAVVCYGWEAAKDAIIRYLGEGYDRSMEPDENNMET